MKERKKLFIFIIIGLLLVIVAPVIINLLVENYAVSFILRSLLVLIIIYLVLEILNLYKKIKNRDVM
jgi:hypothetical protein